MSKRGRAKPGQNGKRRGQKGITAPFNLFGVPQNVRIRNLMPSVVDRPFFDYPVAVSPVSTTYGTFKLLDFLTGAGGILAQYPQHAEGQFAGGLFRLRQRILLDRCEFRLSMVGAESNAVLAADLYNTLRVALIVTGNSYLNTPAQYLTGTMSPTSVVDVKGVYFDKSFSLPSQAYDTTITTPTPQVLNWEGCFDPGLMLVCYSTTAAGTATWDTEERDLGLQVISDSTAVPHPSIQGTFRFFFRYVDKGRQ